MGDWAVAMLVGWAVGHLGGWAPGRLGGWAGDGEGVARWGGWRVAPAGVAGLCGGVARARGVALGVRLLLWCPRG